MLAACKQALTKGKNFDFDRYGWNVLSMWLDPFTKYKFNENSRVIQVEGNIKCGKQDFAKRLANKMGMLYIPPVDVDSFYVNQNGFDYRALNHLLPERLRACDWAMFHENPSRHSVVHMQQYLFYLRLLQYIRAIRHIFNTGQGVVLGRSIFTERAIVEAMHNVGWLPLGYLRGDGVKFYDWRLRYIYTRNMILPDLLKPHLTIYLETPVDICMDNVRNCSNQMIRESKAHVPEFLKAIERAYQEHVLPAQAQNGHLLSYEYHKRAIDEEIDDVVDDIKKLNFEYDPTDSLFEDWDDYEKLWYLKRRRDYCSKSCKDFYDGVIQPNFDIAGLGDSISEVDLILREAVYEANVHDYGRRFKRRTNFNSGPLLDVLVDFEPFWDWEDRLLRYEFR